MASLMDLMRQDSRLSVFASAIELSDLTSVLATQSHLTVLAPTNLAFSMLSNNKMADWFGDIALLRQVIGHHLVAGRLHMQQLIRMRSVYTLSGKVAEIVRDSTSVTVAGAQIEVCDRIASNGILHVVARVLEPNA